MNTKQQIIEMVHSLYSDVGVSHEVTIDRLEDIKQEIDDLLETLKV